MILIYLRFSRTQHFGT